MSNFKLSRISFTELRDEIQTKLREKYQNSPGKYNPASPSGQIITVISAVNELIIQYVENVISVFFDLISTRNPATIRIWAYIAGHSMTRAIAAKGMIRFKVRPGVNTNLLSCNRVILRNKTVIRSTLNSLYYTIIMNEDRTLRIENGIASDFVVVQGKFNTVQLNGTGRGNQTIQIERPGAGDIDNFYYDVYVNDVKWKRKESYKDLNCNALEYTTKTSQDGGMDIIFGNGNFGKKPERNSLIRIEYLVTDGAFGELLLDEENRFEVEDNVYDSDGNIVNMEQIFEIKIATPIMFASSGEDIGFTRNYIPKISKNFVLVNEEQYEELLKSWNNFSRVSVFRRENSNIIEIYLVPDVSSIGTPYFDLDECEFYLLPQEKDRVNQLLLDKGVQIIGSEFRIIDSILSRYVIFLYMGVQEGTDEETLRNEITEKVSDYFLNTERKYIIPRSDITEIIKNVDGVSYVETEFVSEKNENYHRLGFGGRNYDEFSVRGLDARGNILIEKNEIPLIRGGWRDRNDRLYAEKPTAEGFSAINIKITEYTNGI